MTTLSELLRTPLPNLDGWAATLLRCLMLPNLALVRVEGRELLPETASTPERPFIIALNHNNAFESLFVPVLLMFMIGGRKVSFIVDWMFGHLPLVGRLMTLIDPVFAYSKPSKLPFIERRRPKKRSSVIDESLRRLEAGGVLGIFPEGRRNRDPFELLPPKPGIGHLAILSGAPVIPVGIRFRAAERLGREPFAGKMTVSFGEPMRFDMVSDSYGACVRAGDRAGANRLAQRVADEIMQSVSSLCGKRFFHEQSSTGETAITRQPTEELCPA